MPRTKHVALLIETSNAYARGLLRGVVGYARGHGPWAFRLAEHGRGEATRADLAGWKGDGIIARVENRRIAEVVTECGTPAVDVSAARLLPHLPWVETDDVAIARTAADHLIGRGFKTFGYCGDDRFNWSRWRRDAFAEAVAAVGGACEFGPGPRAGADALADWVRGLPKPVGVMACYDIRGRELLDACQRAGAAVPDEVAVVGVDDDELLCELANPPLSSVIPDSRRAGWVAAEILAAAMAGRTQKPTAHLVPPLGVTTRRSTDTLAVADPDLATVMRLIRDRACEGLGVSDLVAAVSVSRRVLESRFAREFGRTPHEEILRVRLDRAKSLLRQSSTGLDAVARRAGFRSGEYLSAVFKRELGTTPGAFRTGET
jgi:LacI family transcriptional regulator